MIPVVIHLLSCLAGLPYMGHSAHSPVDVPFHS